MKMTSKLTRDRSPESDRSPHRSPTCLSPKLAVAAARRGFIRCLIRRCGGQSLKMDALSLSIVVLLPFIIDGVYIQPQTVMMVWAERCALSLMICCVVNPQMAKKFPETGSPIHHPQVIFFALPVCFFRQKETNLLVGFLIGNTLNVCVNMRKAQSTVIAIKNKSVCVCVCCSNCFIVHFLSNTFMF